MSISFLTFIDGNCTDTGTALPSHPMQQGSCILSFLNYNRLTLEILKHCSIRIQVNKLADMASPLAKLIASTLVDHKDHVRRASDSAGDDQAGNEQTPLGRDGQLITDGSMMGD